MVQWLDRLSLDRSQSRPLYQQLSRAIARLIDDGVLSDGAQLPSSRELARALDVNRNTVSSAYDALARDGRVRSHVGQGTFVSAGRPNERTDTRWTLSRAAVSARARVRAPESAAPHADPVDFASLVPDEEMFPVEPFRRVLDAVLAREGKTLLQYGPAAGHPDLRRYIADRLAARGGSVDPDRVLIVNGSQQALDLVCRTLVDPGDRVVVESPTYTIVHPLLAQYQAQVDEVPMTPTGIDREALAATLSRTRPKFLFTMPTFHNPTGATLDREARVDVLDIAARHGVPVVEDDFDSELRFEGEPVPPLVTLDEAEGVLHIGTFSKALFPGVRLGWIVAPPDVVSALGRSKLIADYHTSLLLQAAVLEFCERGHYDEHLGRLATVYREKSRRLLAALASHMPPGVSWSRPEGGFAFWLTLPEGCSAESILAESRELGVLFTPGTNFHARGDGQRNLRLSISRVPLERIEPGVRTLGEILSRRLESTGPASGGASDRREQEPALHI